MHGSTIIRTFASLMISGASCSTTCQSHIYWATWRETTPVNHLPSHKRKSIPWASAQSGSLKPNYPIKDHIQFPISVVNQFHRCFPILSSKILKLENDLRKRNNKIVWISAYFGAPPLSQFHCWGPNKDHLVLEPQHVSQAPLWRSEAVGSIDMHLVTLRFVCKKFVKLFKHFTHLTVTVD